MSEQVHAKCSRSRKRQPETLDNP